MHPVTQFTTAPAPAWTAWRSASATPSATSTWCPSCRRARPGPATKASAAKPRPSSTVVCRAAWRRCWSCASASRPIRAVRKCGGHCRVARAATTPGPAKIQSSGVRRRRAAGEPASRIVWRGAVAMVFPWTENLFCMRSLPGVLPGLSYLVARGHARMHSRGQRASVLATLQWEK